MCKEMALTVHSIGELNASVEEWLVYTEWLNCYFAANDITGGEKKGTVLFSMCSLNTIGLNSEFGVFSEDHCL